MIDQDDIESKDFSCSLPDCIRKIQGISSLMISAGIGGSRNLLGADGLYGLGNILWDVAMDLETINQTLYACDEAKERA